MKRARQGILIIGDIVGSLLSLFLTVFFGFWRNFSWDIFQEHLLPFAILYLCWLVIFYIFDLYNFNVSRDKFLFYPRFFEALAINLVVGIAFFYLSPAFGITPKANLILNILFFGAILLLWHRIFYTLFAKRLLINVSIVGNSKESYDLASEIKKRPYLGYSLKDSFPLSQVNGNFLTKIQNQNIDTLIIGEDFKEDSPIVEALYQCVENKINFMDLAEAYEIICGKVPISFVSKTWFLQNFKQGKKIFYDKAKRIFDLLLALILLIITLPFWLLIALAIKINSRGNVFYKQERVGRDGKTFFLIKFRSMKKDAEKEGAPVWAQKNDQRVTKTGRVLRRTHLDELPQMLNVLLGQISLVGPRPERPKFVEKLVQEIPHYHLRHIIKPGVTGWDQIKFKYARTITDSFDKFQYDLYYLKNRNLFLDFGILLKTFQSFFRKTD